MDKPEKPALEALQDAIERLKKQSPSNQGLIDAIYDVLGDDGIVICASCGKLAQEFRAALCSDCHTDECDTRTHERKVWEEMQAEAAWEEFVCSDRE